MPEGIALTRHDFLHLSCCSLAAVIQQRKQAEGILGVEVKQPALPSWCSETLWPLRSSHLSSSRGGSPGHSQGDSPLKAFYNLEARQWFTRYCSAWRHEEVTSSLSIKPSACWA